MKKSSFAAMVLGTIGGILFAIGMCLCLVEDWNGFVPGVILSGVGVAILLAMVILWRKLAGKEPIHVTGRNVGILLLAIAGAVMFGIGMAYVLAWSNIVLGIILGTVGILALMTLIPVIKGVEA